MGRRAGSDSSSLHGIHATALLCAAQSIRRIHLQNLKILDGFGERKKRQYEGNDVNRSNSPDFDNFCAFREVRTGGAMRQLQLFDQNQG